MESRRSFSGADLIIKGASAIGANVVQIQNLASGTTAADVEVHSLFSVLPKNRFHRVFRQFSNDVALSSRLTFTVPRTPKK